MTQTRRQFLKTTLATFVSSKTLEALAQTSQPATQPSVPRKPIIILDPGHGMGNRKKGIYDPGAVHEKLYESNLVRNQAEIIGKILSKRRYEVKFTRTDEKTETPLPSRAEYANKSKADLFVSLHINASQSQSATGAETYYYPKSAKSRRLATLVQSHLDDSLKEKVREYKPRNPNTKPANFHVLRKTKMPAVLIESGFITNPSDRAYLTAQSELISQAIAEGIHDYFSEKK